MEENTIFFRDTAGKIAPYYQLELPITVQDSVHLAGHSASHIIMMATERMLKS